MRLLDRYIATRLWQGYVLVAVVLVGLLGLLDLVEQLEDVGKGSYQLADALLVTALQLPSRLLEIFPVMTLLGVSLGLGGLATSRELLIIRATGVSTLRICWAVLKTALLLVMLALLMEEFLAAPLKQLAERRQGLLRLAEDIQDQRLANELLGLLNLRDALRLQLEDPLDIVGEGFWSREQRRFLHVGGFEQGDPIDITVYEFDANGELQQFIRAPRATMDDTRWVFQQALWKQREDGVLTTQTPNTLLWESFVDATQVRLARAIRFLRLTPASLSILDLQSRIEYLSQYGQDTLRYRLSLWQKLCLPLNIIAMVILAVPFVMGPLRSVQGTQRLMFGALLGVVFFFANQIVQNAGLLLAWPPALTASLPGGMLLFIGTLLLWSQRRPA